MRSFKFYLQLLLLLVFPISLAAPFIISASFQTSDDFHYHVVWHSLFRDQLFSGDLYPRWLIDQNDGFGAPTFRYYGPAAFYLSSLISVFFPDLSAGYQVAVAATMFISLSGIACFFWLRRTFSERESLIAAIIYSIAPYHLAIDLYKRLAFAELLTFVWMPLILLAVEHVTSTRDRGRSIFMLAICYAGLILTHPPTTLIFSGVPILYALVTSDKERILQTIKVVLGMLIGVTLSAIYLLPALLDQNLVRIDLHQSDYFDFHNWFLFPTVVPTKYNKTIAALTGLNLALIIAAFTICQKLKIQNFRQRLFWILMALGACFMMSTPSTFLYELVYPLQQIQFSSRFNVLLLLSSSFAFADLLNVSSSTSTWKKYIGPTLLLGFVCLTFAVTYKIWKYMQDVPQSYAIEQQQIQVGIDKKVIAGDFLPLGTPFLNPDNLILLESVFNNSSERRVAVLNGEVEVEIKQWGPEDLLLSFNAKETSTVAIRQIYSKTHKAEAVESGKSVALNALKDTNILTVEVPPGNSLIRISHSSTKAESVGLICSLGAVILILSFRVWRVLEQK